MQFLSRFRLRYFLFSFCFFAGIIVDGIDIILIHISYADDGIDVATVCPVWRRLELEVHHVGLKSPSWAIVLPKLETAINVLIGGAPVT